MVETTTAALSLAAPASDTLLFSLFSLLFLDSDPHESKKDTPSSRESERTCKEAAREGHLEVLKYAHENGCPWNEVTCIAAASEGHLEVLKYAHENGCRWDAERICNIAGKFSHLEIVEYVEGESLS